jgi:hypothetical protein
MAGSVTRERLRKLQEKHIRQELTDDEEFLLKHIEIVSTICFGFYSELESRYKAWNTCWDKLRALEKSESRLQDPELQNLQSKIDSLERDAKNVIHDILFELGIRDHPIAR